MCALNQQIMILKLTLDPLDPIHNIDEMTCAMIHPDSDEEVATEPIGSCLSELKLIFSEIVV